MKSEKELTEDREKLIENLKEEILELQSDIEGMTRDQRRELDEVRRNCKSDIAYAMRSSEEILELIEERFGRKVAEEIKLDLKCRRA